MMIGVLADAVMKLNETTKAWDRLRNEIGEDNQYIVRIGENLKDLTDILEEEFHDVILKEVIADERE